MKLEELRPKYIRHTVRTRSNDIYSTESLVLGAITSRAYIEEVKSFEECNGISFLCPQCLAQGKAHQINRWSSERGASPFAAPARHRWTFTGTDFSNISILPDFENELASDWKTCDWNGFVIGGEVQ
jgi:hypothetical protein